MPKNAKRSIARNTDAPDAVSIPSTLQRSPKKAQDVYKQTLAAAENEYSGNEERAHRVAWGAVKHSFEKHGDHWEGKNEKGPSDPRSASGGPQPHGESFGGVDVAKPKAELIADARRLGIAVAARDTKTQIAEKLQQANTRSTRAALAKSSSRDGARSRTK